MIEKELKQALPDGCGLCLYYQPQIDLQRQQWYGVEALLRWFHPEYGQLNTEQFLQVAEQNHLIVELGNWIIAQVCRDMAALQQ